MRYNHTVKGIFLERPDRFTAYVSINGKTVVCHVKNTGRCKELLVKGATVILEKSDNPLRKTLYDLVAVYKGNLLINMDSQAPNKVFHEWVNKTDFFGRLKFVRPETKYGNSRFDFYMEREDGQKIFVEVKGVTLENEGVVLFPDAPTERGLKHVYELIDAKENGFETYIFFVVQMEKALYFTPNVLTHKAFGEGLKKAKEKGVNIVAVNCTVSENSLDIKEFVEVKLGN